jgi:hypothetical protein
VFERDSILDEWLTVSDKCKLITWENKFLQLK